MLGASVFTLGLFLRLTHYYILLCKERETDGLSQFTKELCDCGRFSHDISCKYSSWAHDTGFQDQKHFIRFHSSTFQRYCITFEGKKHRMICWSVEQQQYLHSFCLQNQYVGGKKFYGLIQKFTLFHHGHQTKKET